MTLVVEAITNQVSTDQGMIDGYQIFDASPREPSGRATAEGSGGQCNGSHRASPHLTNPQEELVEMRIGAAFGA